ncbi:MAG: HAMP domain-containing histidine kinase [Bdellovibrio sp.]|nr:HAMP domain-containing histidine kinase [Bdellovibrio sp.]
MFLAIFGTAALSVLVVCVTIYQLTFQYRWADFRDSYIDHMQLLGMALMRVEQAEGDQAVGAARAVQKLIAQKVKIDSDLLQELSDIHSVSQITIYDRDGDPIVSSGEKSQNVFKACGQVRELLTGKVQINESPLSRNQDGSISRDTTVASLDRKYIIEVSVQFAAVTHLLGEMAQHDEDNEYIEMFGPDDLSLGQLHRAGLPPETTLHQSSQKADGAYKIGKKMVVVSSIPARTQNFCIAKNEEPEYRLVTSISTQTFDKEVHRLIIGILLVGLLLLAVAYLLARTLSEVLLRKIELIRTTVGDISRDQDYSKRIAVQDDANDELDELARGFNQMFAETEANQKRLMDAERDKAKSQIAAQVAHDIRSPLMSMSMALNQIQTAQIEALAIVKSAVQRVAGIVQKLADSSKPTQEEPGVELPKLTLLEPILLSVVNEHRMKDPAQQSLEVKGIGMHPQVWCVLQVIEVQTAFSNMINNAFEAGASKVELSLDIQGKKSVIKISDNGKGMSADITEKIFERSFTHGKSTGTGLGLFQAKAAIEWAGGTIEVASTPGQGTVFTVTLPKEKKPVWMPESIVLEKGSSIFFVDDDANVLTTWRKKMAAVQGVTAHFFGSIGELEKLQSLKQWPANAILVIDQNLQETKEGLEVLAALSIGKRSYLCTSEFDEKIIQDEIRKLGAWLLPKPCIWSTEIKTGGN